MFESFFSQATNALTSLAGQSRRAHPRVPSSLGNAHQTLSQSRTPHHRWTLPACPSRRARPPSRTLAKLAVPPNRRRRARLARRVKPSLGQFLPHLPRRAPQSRITPPPKPRPERCLPIGTFRPARRCACQSDLFQRSASTGSGSAFSRLAEDATGAGCDDPSRELAVERGRNARLTTRAHFSHDRVPARARVR